MINETTPQFVLNEHSILSDQEIQNILGTLKIRANQLLKENSISINKLADFLGKNQSNLSKHLNPDRKENLTLDEILNISKIFNVSLDWLFGKTDVKNPKNNIETLLTTLLTLVKSGTAKIHHTTIEEKNVYKHVHDEEYNEDFWVSNQNENVIYPTIYFPKYINPQYPKYQNKDKDELLSYFSDCGNEDYEMAKVNKVLEKIDYFLPKLKEGLITEEDFEKLLKDK